MEHTKVAASTLVCAIAVGPKSAELVRTPGIFSPELCVTSVGSEALRLLRCRPVDLVLSDLQVSDMSAMRLLDRIQHMGLNMTFVVTIDSGRIQDGLLAMIGGASGYVLLGQTADKVRACIELARRRSRFDTLSARGASRLSHRITRKTMLERAVLEL